MKRTLRWTIAALVCMAVGVLPAFAITLELPFKTLEAARAAAAEVGLGRCAPDHIVLDLGIPGKSDTQNFRLLASDTRFLVIEGQVIGDSNEPLQVYFGNLVNKDELVVTEILSIEGAKMRYPGPCNYLFPEGA